uniref:Phospho-2-dehydro-3-deoxyheptonate aldolase n=1 Tax=Brassica oleracea var. oleracea TaxID=109376 RepID=A0A0D3A1E1_BRAOL
MKPNSKESVSAALEWTPESWKLKKALQLPDYPDAAELKTIEAFPPIVFAGEARNLEERLADAAVGKAFLLQGGDCAESFKEFNATNIRDTFRVLLQMSIVLTFGGQVPIVKVGRMAGPFEEKDGVKLPSYKGDNINGDTFDDKSRIPDPNRMIRAYTQSALEVTLQFKELHSGTLISLSKASKLTGTRSWRTGLMRHWGSCLRVDSPRIIHS